MSKVTKNTTLAQITKNYSNGKEILTGFGLHCISCPMSQIETIEEAGAVHGIDVEFMLKKLNEDLIENKKENSKK